MAFRAPESRAWYRVLHRFVRLSSLAAFGWSLPAVLLVTLCLGTGGFAAPAVPAASGGSDGGSRAAEAALDGGVLPVLVSIPASVAASRGPLAFGVALAPGEARKGEAVEAVAVASVRRTGQPGQISQTGQTQLEPRPLKVTVADRHPDGSAARLSIRVDGLGAGELLVLVRPPRVADPTTLEPGGSADSRHDTGGTDTAGAGVTVFGGAVASLVQTALWHGELAREGASAPPWWDEAAARFPVGTDPADLEGRIGFVEAAYAEKGRPRRAIRLYQEIADEIAPGAVPDAAVGSSRLRSWLRVCHEIAHLYDGALQDDARALGWALRCASAPLANREEERQNRIAAGLAAARTVEGLGRPRAALGLYRLLARDLLLDPDPYGTLLLPQIFVHLADGELAAGRTAEAEAAYRAADAAAERLPATTPSNFLAPGSVARAALRRLATQGLAFSRVADGSYQGQAYGYNAPVGVRLTFEGGRCTELHVTDLGDKRPLDAYRVLPERILETQSLEVDAVTGATVTSRAIVSAATEAVAAGGGAGRAASPGRSGDGRGGAKGD